MHKILLVLLLSEFVVMKAQYVPVDATLEKHLFKANLLSPGVEYEYGFGRYLGFNVCAGLTPAIVYSEQMGVKYFFNPSVNLQLRYYYNLNRRSLANKLVEYNSADFVALHLRGTGSTLITNSDLSYQGNYGAALVWGLQRTFKNGIHIGTYIGPGISVADDGKARFQLFTGLRVGYIFRTHAERQERKIRSMEKRL